jgi:hypothetical protein
MIAMSASGLDAAGGSIENDPKRRSGGPKCWIATGLPRRNYATATASISISKPSEYRRETSTNVMAGATGGLTVFKKRSRAGR